MMRRGCLLMLVLGAAVALNALGCGVSGSEPVLFSEVRFDVVPNGQATFTVDELDAAGVRRSLPDSATPSGLREFTVSGVISFVFLNIGPPYVGIFSITPDSADISVHLNIDGADVAVDVTTGAAKPQAMVASGLGTGTPIPLTSPQEIRFEVCAPVPGASTCLAASPQADPGVFGVSFSGTIGDPFTSHILGSSNPSVSAFPVAPAIYFLENASQSVNGAFRSLVPDQALQAQLFVDGALAASDTETNKSVIVRTQL
jgi:hypothetical protein